MGSEPELAWLVVVVHGGVAWAACLLGAVRLTICAPARWRGSVAWVERTCLDRDVLSAKVAELLTQGRQTRGARAEAQPSTDTCLVAESRQMSGTA